MSDTYKAISSVFPIKELTSYPIRSHHLIHGVVEYVLGLAVEVPVHRLEPSGVVVRVRHYYHLQRDLHQKSAFDCERIIQGGLTLRFLDFDLVCSFVCPILPQQVEIRQRWHGK